MIQLENPINLVLLAICGYMVIDAYRPKPKIAPPMHPKVILLRSFAPQELSLYNGASKKEIYIAIKGTVFDVSSKANFYGPGPAYENFAGRDASRGMAKHSFEKEMLTDLSKPIDDLSDLSIDECSALEDWSNFFKNKYPIVGDLKPADVNNDN